jgi:transcription factor Sp
MSPAFQTVTIDGQEAIFIPTGGGGQQVQIGHNQALLTSNGQIIRAPTNQAQSLPFTLQNVGVQSGSQGVTVRTAGGMQQVLQLPMQQTATISVQVPVSTANGQTVYQTLQLPVQMISSGIPGLMQGGTQMQVLSPLQVIIDATPFLRLLIALITSFGLLLGAPATAVCANNQRQWTDPDCANS